ncbi:hypothetical protein H4582DRAFT_1942442 [Lactarius indigo]|nr:hypothetical protein H4582DRAFT_1942442 [Lactarius indigo]
MADPFGPRLSITNLANDTTPRRSANPSSMSTSCATVRRVSRATTRFTASRSAALTSARPACNLCSTSEVNIATAIREVFDDEDFDLAPFPLSIEAYANPHHERSPARPQISAGWFARGVPQGDGRQVLLE